MRFYLLLLGLGLLACLSPRRPRAQQPAAPPDGIGPQQVGRPLRLVAELARVPLPPGGLIPFRQGAYWGYADTTGRVWIEPVLEPEPPFFVGDVVALYGHHLPKLRDPKERATFNGRKEPFTFWLNAHGEFLAVDERGEEPEAALLLPGGRLRAGRVADHLGEPALTMDRRLAAPQVRPAALPPPQPPSSPPLVPSPYEPVGEGRFAYTRVQTRHRLVEISTRSTRRNRHGHSRRYHVYRFFVPNTAFVGTAIVDSAGRPLTEFKYFAPDWYWHRFRGEGWMDLHSIRRPPQPPGTVDHGYVLLSRNGREIPLPPAVQRVLPVQDGLALVWSLREAPRPDGHGTMSANDLGGIIDTTGRWLLPMTGRLSGPDQYGYYRHAALVGADSVTRFITRRAEPVFADLTFRYAGPFQNGRAWVEAADGRQGFINARGQWVTPLRYELLAVPTSVQRYWGTRYLRPSVGSGYSDSYPLADTAYVLCRRAGKYGFVARRSGREVVPARYDSVLYHLHGGLACLYRGGRPYVVDARGRELVQAEYYGGWYGYRGRPLQVYRPTEGRWSVVDTSGRQRLPWLPGTGYLTPEGRAVVREPVRVANQAEPDGTLGRPCSGVVDSLGRVVVSFRSLVAYSGPLPRLHMTSLGNRRYDYNYLWPLLDSLSGPGPGCYVVGDEATRAQYLLRARDLQPLLDEAFSSERAPDTEAGPSGLRALPGGWHAGRRWRDGRSVLISPTGRQHVAPPGTGWHLEYFSAAYRNPTVPFRYGVERVRWGRGTFGPEDPQQQGYVTPGGRPLWKE